MKIPPRCPWCGATYTGIIRLGMPSRIVYYECGTKLSDYPAMVQVTTPCKPVKQWIRPKLWGRILKRNRKVT